MKKSILLILLALLCFGHVWAKPQLLVGDVLLQPLKCWACTLIEEEENTIYSHVGVVVSVNPLMVAEAFGVVRQVSLEEYDLKTEPGQKIKVLRFQNAKLVSKIQKRSFEFLNLFQSEFQHLKYDHDFLWHNVDEAGQEKLYCSELVTKMFQAFLGIELPVKRMHFNQNREGWERFFQGKIPDREWGNSPGDLERSDWFYALGEL